MKRTLETIKYHDNTEELARFAKALGHPTRIAILKYLEKSCSCLTSELVEIFPLAQSTISQHLKELKNVGLIKGEIDPPKVKYCIDAENWARAKNLFCDFLDAKPQNNSCSM
ncbi:MAG: winged helix-turn-helix transcriptional regulator [Flavobacteriales bacterium]|nr:winged helix-turn-helix transcriptional regulator [Flavobacteriales bacterium]